MGLDASDINRHLKAEFGEYEDSLQDAWVAVLEEKAQTVTEIKPIARKVRNRAIGQYLNRKYRKVSLQKPMGHNGDADFTLECILPAPVPDDKSEPAKMDDTESNGLYKKMVDFLIEEYLTQKKENLELKKKHFELTAEKIRLHKEWLEFKRCRYESWKRLMEDKGRQKEELQKLHMQLQREKLEFRAKSFKTKKRTGKESGRSPKQSRALAMKGSAEV